MEEERRKVYVEVDVTHRTDGTARPQRIKFENGEVYEIDRVKYCCRAASTKVGGTGLRYTVLICGTETFLLMKKTESGLWKAKQRNSLRMPPFISPESVKELNEVMCVTNDNWTPIPMYCSNCGALLYGYRNDEGKIKYECKRCGTVAVRVQKDDDTTRLTSMPRKGKSGTIDRIKLNTAKRRNG